ncbi:MAG: hypothetical protein MUE41_05645 [Gemmatimonadaceae bacterium]|nr:hypothetical protein [Gemmatimonadaceae bacterium]
MRDPDEAIEALGVVTSTLDAMRATHFVTGSLASGVHGAFRAINDIDLVVDLPVDRVEES